MANPNDESRTALEDPFTAPAIGLTDRLDDDDSTSVNLASATDHTPDASGLNGKDRPPDASDDDEDAWDDEDDDEGNSEEDEDLSLYENWLDGSEKHWNQDQGRLQRGPAIIPSFS